MPTGNAAAASLVLTVVAGFYPDYLQHPLADYRTRIGEQTSITLADGSVAHLNTDTAIDVSISDNERRIELLRGEAEFDVAHDAWRRGRLLMNFVPLKQAIAEINRYRRSQIRLLDDKLGEREVNIAVDIQQIDAWLQALQQTLTIKIVEVGPFVFLQS